MKIIDWVKQNKLSFILLLILLFVLIRNFSYRNYGLFRQRSLSTYPASDNFIAESPSYGMTDIGSGSVANLSLEAAPKVQSQTEAIDSSIPRMMTQNASVSLLVKNVEENSNQIIAYVNENEGFLVSSNITNPDNAAYAYLTVNILSQNLDETLAFLKSLSVKIVSQNITGRDITEEYQDINSRLTVLKTNKARFEEIMASTGITTEILRIQREIFSLQDQIDNLIGRQQYLEEKAKYSQISINLSTDELSLPYTPDNKWRPQVVFKNAVRSLLKTLQALANLSIWLLVFSVIIIPAYFLIKLIKNKIKTKKGYEIK